MAEGKDSFVFYKSFYDAIKQIPEEYQLELYNAILQYSLEGIEPINLSNIASAMFTLIKPNIDSSQKKYEASVNNGKKGGRPKKETQQKPNNNPKETQQKPNENLNDNVNDNEDENDNEEDMDNISSISNDKDVAKIDRLMVECLNTTNTNNTMECIGYLQQIPIELIEYGLKKTARKQYPSWQYAMTILDDYVRKKFTTIEQVKADELNYKSQSTNKKAEEEFLNEYR